MSKINVQQPRSKNNSNSLQNALSRYVCGGLAETSNNFIEWWERYKFEKDPSDIVYVVENINESRLDLISSIFYNEPRYAWFIAQYNNIIDPVSEVTAGRILLIPTKDRMMLMFGTRKGGLKSSRLPVKTISPIIT